MSYILDALKESQRNREGTQVPNILTEVDASAGGEYKEARSSHRYWVYIVLLAILGGGIAGWWASQDNENETIPLITETPVEDSETRLAAISSERAPVSQPPMEIASPDLTTTETPPAVPQDVVEDLSPEKEKTAEASPEVAMVDAPVVEPSPAPPIEIATEVVAEAEPIVHQQPRVAPPAEAGVLTPDIAPEQHVEPESGTTETVAMSEKAPAAVPETPEPQAPAPQSDESAAGLSFEEQQAIEEASIPQVRQLPLDIQQQVDWVNFSVHLYSRDPAQRLVKIDGVVRREGENIGRDVTLERITPRGAIFHYQDYEFKIVVH